MASAKNPLVWVITGCSSGFGKHFVEQALKRGQKVVATGRNIARLEDLKKQGADTIEFDPNAPIEKLSEFADKVLQKYGHIDVLVNNAGYMQEGILEETSSTVLEQQFHTNVFAPINLSKAFLPSMRKRKNGIIFMIGSVAAYMHLAGIGLYDSSKAALKSLTHVLALETQHLGIKVAHIEPGLFRTEVFTNLDPKKRPENAIDDYDGVREAAVNYFLSTHRKQPGDPGKLGSFLVDLALGEGVMTGKDWPDALLFGKNATHNVGRILQADMNRIESWKEISAMTDFDE